MGGSLKAIIQFIGILILISFTYVAINEYNINSLKKLCNNSFYQKTDNQIINLVGKEQFILRGAFDITDDDTYTRFLMKNSNLPNPAVCQLHFKNGKVIGIKFFHYLK